MSAQQMLLFSPDFQHPPSPPNGTTESPSFEVPEQEYEDPFCVPGKPSVVQFADITSAAFKIRDGIVRTPCMKSHLSELTGMEIFLKKDFLQFTGSFKERGASYALMKLTTEQKSAGVISASLGNHAQALSYHGQRLKIPVTVIMPIVAPIMKIQSCRNLGANVVVQGRNMKEAKLIAMKLAKERSLVYINGYDHPDIIAGQGTIGLEVVDEVPNIDAIVVPVGGAGLIAGVALAVKTLNPHIKVIGVESERCASFSKAVENGGPVMLDIESTLADGLAVPMVGYNAFATAAPLVDRTVVDKRRMDSYCNLAVGRVGKMRRRRSRSCWTGSDFSRTVRRTKRKASRIITVRR
ncbi:unnamed protein product [Bemisia tabaci]|uniref:Serine racemase n=1 Tax=Bemisia tabaci TaxID=7038 RepID=A0A9P0EYG4_BEMTA|nr:unnamed protein product [Bemisia tabaci]